MKTPNITRVPCVQSVFTNIRTYLQSREIYYIAGHTSIFVPSRQEKYILSHRKDGTPVARIWPNGGGEKILMSPGEAARTELERAFPSLTRIGWRADNIKQLDWRSPMLFNGPYKGKGVYIDIKSAYWQIYRKLWLDVAFPCGYGRLDLSPVAESLKDWKAARNAVVGISRSRQATGVKGLKTVNLSTVNPFLSPGLWATVQAILNALAFEAERFGAIYVATDGYIFPVWSNVWEFQEYLYNLGIDYRQVSGDVNIKAFGAYRVNNKTTLPYLALGDVNARPFRAIRMKKGDHRWLLAWWAHSVNKWRSSIERIRENEYR